MSLLGGVVMVGGLMLAGVVYGLWCDFKYWLQTRNSAAQSTEPIDSLEIVWNLPTRVPPHETIR